MKISELEEANRLTLKELILHRKRVAEQKEFNHMSVSNLSSVYGPTLLRSMDYGPFPLNVSQFLDSFSHFFKNHSAIKQHLGLQALIVEILMTRTETIFPSPIISGAGDADSISSGEFYSICSFSTCSSNSDEYVSVSNCDYLSHCGSDLCLSYISND